MWQRFWMDLPVLPSMLPHCHSALPLRCSKVPGSDSGICLLEKLLFCFPNTIQFLFSKLSTIFLIKDHYPSRQVPVQVNNRNIDNKIPEQQQCCFYC